MNSRELRPLDPVRDRDLMLANRARVLAEMPELVPIIKEMVESGCLDGWRSVTWVGKSDEWPHGIDPARWCQPVVASAAERAMTEKMRTKR